MHNGNVAYITYPVFLSSGLFTVDNGSSRGVPMRYVWLFLLVALILGNVASLADAATMTFGVTQGGTLSYAGGNSPVVGTDIPLGNNLFVSPTLFVAGTSMDFSTGPFSHFESFGVTPAGTPGGGNAFFASGGQIGISGTLVSMQPGGVNPQAIFNGVFFEGQFTGSPVLQLAPSNTLDVRNYFDANFRGQLNTTFAALAQFPDDVFYTGAISARAPAPLTGTLVAFSGTPRDVGGGLNSTSIPITPVSEPGGGGNGGPVIPEPATVLLVASGLAGIGLWRKPWPRNKRGGLPCGTS
jgi:hypothetical protein